MNHDTAQAYNTIADSFGEDRKQAPVNELLIKFTELFQPGNTILDVGCGMGIPIDSYLVAKGLKIIGIDISERLLEKARQNVPQGNFLNANILEFETEEKFSGIVAWDSLFHLRLEQHAEAFMRLWDLLAEGGYLLFSHGGKEAEIEGDMHGEHFSYSSLGPEKTKAFLEKLGFQIIEWSVDSSEPNGYMAAIVRK